jgi:hypothetical protein
MREFVIISVFCIFGISQQAFKDIFQIIQSEETMAYLEANTFN